jgi:hypothetical protein
MSASPATVARSLKALPIRNSGAPWPVVSTANVVPSLEVMFVLSAFGACGVGDRGRLPPARAVATAG